MQTDRPAFRLAVSIAVLVVALFTVRTLLSDRFYVVRDVPNRTGVGVDLELVPEGAVRWLAENVAPGALLNNFNSGSWLLFRLAPEVKPFIDPRLVSPDLYYEVRRAVMEPAGFDALTERHGIGTVVLAHPSPESTHLLPRLARDPKWSLAFRDENTTIHVRSDLPAPSRRQPPLILAPLKRPAAERLDAWLAGFKREALPAAELTDAFLSSLLGDGRREVAAWRRARARAPRHPRVRAYFAAHPELDVDP